MKLSTHLFAITFTLASHSSMAMVYFNIQATITTTENNGPDTPAFSLNEIVNISIALKEDAGSPNTVNDDTTAAWTDSDTADSTLFDSITINGATGTFSYANGAEGGEQLAYTAADPGQISIITGNDMGIGIQRNGQEFQAVYLYNFATSENVGPLSGDNSVTIESLFLSGDYGAAPGSVIQFATTDGSSYGGAINSFDVTNVPEPTSYALAFGFLATATIWLRRRK